MAVALPDAMALLNATTSAELANKGKIWISHTPGPFQFSTFFAKHLWF